MWLILFSLVVGYSTLHAEDNISFKEFKKSDYPLAKFNISKVQFRHGDVLISIIQVKNKRETALSANEKYDFYCRAWLRIEKNGKTLDQEYFKDIEAMGGSYGIFVPKKQPSPDYFLIEKIGDYESSLYLIGKDGKVIKIHGGLYFLTEHSKYLFGENSEAEDGLTEVFDLVKGKLIFSKQIQNYTAYQKGEMYFYSEGRLAPNDEEIENKDKILYFDFHRSEFIEKSVTRTFWSGVRKIKHDFDPRDYDDCVCKSKSKK